MPIYRLLSWGFLVLRFQKFCDDFLYLDKTVG
jgi:hypothetical protein